MKKDNFHKLLDKFQNDTLTEREKAQFEKKLETSAHARKVFHNFNKVCFALEAVEADGEFSGSNPGRIVRRRLRRRRSFASLAAGIAAAVALPLLIFTFYRIYNTAESGVPLYTEVVSTNAKVTHVILPDGSRVALYSGSALRYPENFTAGERNVHLRGEATFEVTSDPRNPFFVNTLDGVKVKAYGTKFNVCAYEKENTSQVYLMGGAVDFIAPSTGNSVTLKPEICLTYGRMEKNVLLTHRSPEEYDAHQQGILMFRKTPLKEIVLKISRLYDVEIIVENDRILQYLYTGSFKDESLYQIMDVITQSSPDLRWSVQGETILLSSK
ncbi:MAG: DUF4974 domain-containing protein [Rikenellaceae bacterium]|nr:DUF4974 domain-containing protein [Rikenellaceae bacterium]